MNELAINDDYLSLSVELATAATAVARTRPHNGEYSSKKGPSDIVTETDRKIEQKIRDSVVERYPSHSVVGEEYDDKAGDSNVTWIVDPVDGTTNYQHDLSPSCTMIAVEVDGSLHSGVIKMHHTGDLYYAVDGEGAYRNHEPISTSDTETIEESLFAIEVTGKQLAQGDDRSLEHMRELLQASHGVRKLRCAGRHFTLLAEGKLESVSERHTNPWDAAAGAVIIREAGGTVTDFEGNSDWGTLTERPVHILATNGDIHEESLDVMGDSE